MTQLRGLIWKFVDAIPLQSLLLKGYHDFKLHPFIGSYSKFEVSTLSVLWNNGLKGRSPLKALVKAQSASLTWLKKYILRLSDLKKIENYNEWNTKKMVYINHKLCQHFDFIIYFSRDCLKFSVFVVHNGRHFKLSCVQSIWNLGKIPRCIQKYDDDTSFI